VIVGDDDNALFVTAAVSLLVLLVPLPPPPPPIPRLLRFLFAALSPNFNCTFFFLSITIEDDF